MSQTQGPCLVVESNPEIFAHRRTRLGTIIARTNFNFISKPNLTSTYAQKLNSILVLRNGKDAGEGAIDHKCRKTPTFFCIFP